MHANEGPNVVSLLRDAGRANQGSKSENLAAGGCAGSQVDPRMGLHIRIYMYEQDGVGWAEIREVL